MKTRSLLIVVLGVIVMGVSVYYLTSRHYKLQIEEIVLKDSVKIDSVDKQLQSILKITDTASIKASFEQIDSSLVRINKSLAARGLGVIKTRDISVNERMEHNTLADFAKHYESLTRDLELRLLYTPFGMPYNGPKSSGFGTRHDPFYPDSIVSHMGLDFVGNYGDSVKVTADGVVEFAGVRGGYGNCIIVKHESDFETLYGHLSKILVKEGDRVIAGDHIGLIGSTGRSTGAHLHYEVIRNSAKVNPEKYLKL